MRYVVCSPSDGAASVAPCADLDGVPFAPVVYQAPAPGEVTLLNAHDLFVYGLGAVLLFWLLGLAIGMIFSVVTNSD